MSALRRAHTAVLERNSVSTGDFATEPYEAAWAGEAIWFLRILDVSPGARLHATAQLSPDGLTWCDDHTLTVPNLTIDAPGLWMLKLTHFGHWLRLRCNLGGDAPRVQGADLFELEGIARTDRDRYARPQRSRLESWGRDCAGRVRAGQTPVRNRAWRAARRSDPKGLRGRPVAPVGRSPNLPCAAAGRRVPQPTSSRPRGACAEAPIGSTPDDRKVHGEHVGSAPGTLQEKGCAGASREVGGDGEAQAGAAVGCATDGESGVAGANGETPAGPTTVGVPAQPARSDPGLGSRPPTAARSTSPSSNPSGMASRTRSVGPSCAPPAAERSTAGESCTGGEGSNDRRTTKEVHNVTVAAMAPAATYSRVSITRRRRSSAWPRLRAASAAGAGGSRLA